MIPPIIAFAILSGLSTVPVRMIISRRPFYVRNLWSQIILSMIIGVAAWLLAVLSTRSVFVDSTTLWGDIICGLLILLSAFWCNYWVGNLAGGFRVQMHLNLAMQKKPISMEEWMGTFGGLGMEAFLKDRIMSVLIPSNTVALENNQLYLLKGWGTFFGRLMGILKTIFPKVRSD